MTNSQISKTDLESLKNSEIDKYRKLWLAKAPTRDDLHDWIYYILGVWIPRYQVCDGHVSPYGYVYDRYFLDVLKTIAWGARGSGKSYMTGLNCWLSARFYPRWAANILGGSYNQSEKSYKATMDFWGATQDIGGYDVLEKEPLVSKTVFKNGSYYEISTASTKSAHGPHQPVLCLDEIDEMEVDVLNGAMSQPQTLYGYPASWHFTSTMHRVGGLMGEWVDNAQPRGYKLYTWCILETMTPCYDYHCSTCPIDKWCEGKLKNIIAIAEEEQIRDNVIDKGDPCKLGFNTVEDVISKIQNAEQLEGIGADAQIKPLDIEADLFCKRPSRSGLVYKEFDRNKHVINDIEIGENWKRYRSFDFGATNPWVCLYIAEDEQGHYFIYDEIYVRERVTLHMIPRLIDGIRYEYNVADPAGKGDRILLQENGIITLAPKNPDVLGGILFVKQLLQVKADGKPGLQIVGSKCPNTIFELEKGYRYPDDKMTDVPIKENDHSCDSLRNFILVRRQGGVRQTVGVYG